MSKITGVAALIKELNSGSVSKIDQKNKTLKEATEISGEISNRGLGQFGTIMVIEGQGASFLAKNLNIPNNWKLIEVGHIYAAYDGDRLSFFENRMDFTDDLGDDEDDF